MMLSICVTPLSCFESEIFVDEDCGWIRLTDLAEYNTCIGLVFDVVQLM